MHDLNYFHKGFMPYNILWSKPSEEARSIRLVLIDVATGRQVFPVVSRRLRQV